VWWLPHLHRHQWIVPEYIRTLDSTVLVLWYIDSLLGKHLETNKETTVVDMQQRSKQASTTIDLMCFFVVRPEEYLEDNWDDPVS
jgi:hypothetical protein